MNEEVTSEMCKDNKLSDIDLAFKITARFNAKLRKRTLSVTSLPLMIRDLNRAAVEVTLMNNGNNQTKCAETLGVTRATVAKYNHIKTTKKPTRRIKPKSKKAGYSND